MDKTSLTVLSSLVGVVLGFALSQFADWFKSIQSSKRQQKSIRQIIFLEIKKNYRLLNLFWKQIKKSAQIDEEMPCDPAEHPLPIILL